jgi:hypothetical protein
MFSTSSTQSARHRNVNCRSNINGTKQHRKFCLRYFMLISQLEGFHVPICLDQTVIGWLLWTVIWTACRLTSHHPCTFNSRCETLKYEYYTIIVLKHETTCKVLRKSKTSGWQRTVFKVIGVNIKILSLFSKTSIPALGPIQPCTQLVPWAKAAGSWSWLLSLSSDEVKNEWSYTTTPPVCLHGVCRGTSTFTLLYYLWFVSRLCLTQTIYSVEWYID